MRISDRSSDVCSSDLTDDQAIQLRTAHGAPACDRQIGYRNKTSTHQQGRLIAALLMSLRLHLVMFGEFGLAQAPVIVGVVHAEVRRHCVLGWNLGLGILAVLVRLRLAELGNGHLSAVPLREQYGSVVKEGD